RLLVPLPLPVVPGLLLVVRGRRSRVPAGQSAGPLPCRLRVLRGCGLLRPSSDLGWAPFMTSTSAPATDTVAKAVLTTPPRRRRRSKNGLRPLTCGERVFRVVHVLLLSGFALICLITSAVASACLSP